MKVDKPTPDFHKESVYHELSVITMGIQVEASKYRNEIHGSSNLYSHIVNYWATSISRMQPGDITRRAFYMTLERKQGIGTITSPPDL